VVFKVIILIWWESWPSHRLVRAARLATKIFICPGIWLWVVAKLLVGQTDFQNNSHFNGYLNRLCVLKFILTLLAYQWWPMGRHQLSYLHHQGELQMNVIIIQLSNRSGQTFLMAWILNLISYYWHGHMASLKAHTVQLNSKQGSSLPFSIKAHLQYGLDISVMVWNGNCNLFLYTRILQSKAIALLTPHLAIVNTNMDTNT